MIDEHANRAARRVSGARRSPMPLIALLLAAALFGCGAAPFELTLAALENQRARWQEQGILDYEFQYRERCDCGSSPLRQARVEVRNGQVVSISETGQPAGAEPLSSFPTIEGLFDRIDAAIRDEAAALSVTYDAQMGYPRVIIIDYDYGADHDEVTIDATDLTVL